MKTKAFWFTAPDGTRLKRASKTRIYTHAILVKRDGKWWIASCIGRPDLVADRLEQWGKGHPEVIAVPCEPRA